MFKRKFNKKIEENIPSYEEFMEKNGRKLLEEDIIIPKEKKSKVCMHIQIRRFAAIACACFVVAIGVIAVYPLFNRETIKDDFFSENDIKQIICEDDGEYESEYKILALLSNYDIQKYVWTKSNKDVWLTCDGEYETENNYYIINVNVRLDKRYHYINQPLYDTLTETIAVEDKLFYYGGYLAEDGVYDYKIKYTENENEVYLSVSCLNEDILELVEAVSANQLDVDNTM